MPGKTVFTFPGQGSFAPDLLRRMYDTRAGLRPLFYAVDQASGDILGEPFLPMVLGDPARQTGSRDLDQLGIYLADYATAQLWIERGVTPDALLGHSFGELAAFATAGIFSFEDGARMVCQRVLSLREGAVAGRMAAVSANELRVQAMLNTFANASVISVVNHPEQTVVSGPEDELAELRVRFAKEAVSVTQLQSNYPFHSPLLAGSSRAFRIALRGHRFAIPQYPVMIGTDLTWVGSETDVTDAMARQLVTPLNFVALVGKYHAEGYSRFIECGGGTIVTKVIARVLKSATTPHQEWATFPAAADINERLAAIEREMAGGPAAAPVAPVAPATRFAPAAPTQPAALAQPALPAQPAAPAATEPIAIVGMGCVLPGGADSPEQFWKNITTGVSGIVDLADSIPHARHDFVGGDGESTPPKIVSDKTYTLLNGSVVKVLYDANLLAGRYTDDEFSHLTKGQQMLATAIAQADRGVRRAPQARVQCILGSTADGVAELDEAHFAASVREVLKKSDVSPADSEAFATQLNGGLPGWQRHPDEFRPYDLYAAVSQKSADIPREQTYLVDSACSSSLYSLALGARALRNGETDLVYAGGVFAPGPANNNLFAQFRGLTPNASRPFDAKADGVVFGDGAGVLVLKRLSDAIDAGDKVIGVIRSEGFSSDGKSPSINVPQAEGQAAAVQVAYTRAALDPRSVQYIEAHATATPVGDAVEFKALRRAFPDKTDRLLGSVKSLIGHTGWTSGVASVIKICKAIEHQKIPRQFAYTSPNPQIDLADTGFTINVEDAHWAENTAGEPRRAAINSFGFGGTNAHFVVEEFDREYHARVAAPFRGRNAASPDVVIVGAEGLFPESGNAFDRKTLRMPKKRMVLPDVAEHMDATQYLATMAAELIAETLPADALKNRSLRIGVALGVESKTERGVRANERVFLDRLERVVNGAAASSDVLGRIRETILGNVIPSGPYTLPGLMPNVAASRITHTFDWHGPNIVVDRGAASLVEALQIGLKFIRAGDCEVVLAGGVHAWVGHNREDQEGVALAAIATAETAAKYHLPILARVEFGAASPNAVAVRLDPDGRTRAATGARELVQAVRDVKQRSAQVVLRSNGHAVMTLVPADHPRVAKPVAASTAAPGTSAPRTGAPGTPAPSAPVAPPAPVTATVAPAGASHAYVQGTRITNYTPVLVESPALPLPSTVATRTYLFACDDRDAWLAFEQSGALQGLTYHVVAPQGIAIPGAHPIDVSTEDSLRESLARIKDVAADTIIAIKQLTHHQDDQLLLGDFQQQRALLDVLFALARDRYDAIGRRQVALATLCLGAVRSSGLNAFSGLFAGFIKSTARELPVANCKAVATDEAQLAQGLSRVVAELEAGDRIAEVAYHGGTRLRFVLGQSEPLHRQGKPWVGKGSVVLATGAGRGVTAVLAEYLVDQGCTVVALGRTDPTDLPDHLRQLDEAGFQAYESQFYKDELARDRTKKMPELKKLYERYQASNELASVMRRTSSAPGKYEYIQCDINDRTTIDEVIDRVLSRHGRLDMVMHGAGVQVSKALPRKTLNDFQRIVTTKLASLNHLYQSCRHRGLDKVHFHLLTSAFSYLGNDGQPDYGAANEAMNRLAGQLNHAGADAHWSSVAWLGWAGIGMTRGTEYAALAANRRLRGVTREEGQKLFADAIAGPPASAVNVILAEGEEAFYGPEIGAPVVLGPATAAPAIAATTAQKTTEWIVGAETMPFLADHLVRGVPTVPGAFLIAMAGDAALKLFPHLKIVDFERTRFLRLVRAHGDRPATVRAVATFEKSEAGDTVVQVQILMDFIHKTGRVLGANLLHTEIYVRMADTVRDPAGLELSPLRGRAKVLPDPYCLPGSPVQLDGVFRAMQEVHVTEIERNAPYQLPSTNPHPSAFEHLIPKIIMVDAFWRFGTVRVTENGGLGVYVPEKCDVMKVFFDYENDSTDLLRGPITFAGANPRPEGDLLHVGPITAFNAAGKALLRVEGGLCRRFGELEWP